MNHNQIDARTFNPQEINKLREVNKQILAEYESGNIDKSKLQKLAETQLYRSMMAFGGVNGRAGYYPY